MTNSLPPGWFETTLSEVGKWSSGGTPSRRNSAYFGKGIPWVKSGDLPDGQILKTDEEITHDGLNNSSAKIMPAGTICMALYGATIGKLGVMTFPAATNQACANVVPDNRIVASKYLFQYLLFRRQNFIEQGQGGAQPNISQEIIRSDSFLLAPLSEQQRIAEILESLLSKVDDCQDRLARVQTILKHFRQSVLAAACSGRLTADWRIQRAAPALGEPGAEFDDFPKGWSAVCVGGVIDDLKYGTSQKCGYEKRGVPVLRIPNIAKGVIDHDDLKYAELPAKEQKQLHLLPGDILIVRSNGSVSLVGKCALVGENERGFSYAGYLIRIRPNQTIVSPEFLNLALSSYDVRLQIELEARSTSGVNNINSEEVRALQLSLPPLDEQEEIVRRVNGLFALADKIETRYKAVQQQVDRLPQSILAKAFRGELVPTEAELAEREGRSYESAEQLLQRIRAAKSKTGNTGSGWPTKRRGQAG